MCASIVLTSTRMHHNSKVGAQKFCAYTTQLLRFMTVSVAIKHNVHFYHLWLLSLEAHTALGCTSCCMSHLTTPLMTVNPVRHSKCVLHYILHAVSHWNDSLWWYICVHWFLPHSVTEGQQLSQSGLISMESLCLCWLTHAAWRDVVLFGKVHLMALTELPVRVLLTPLSDRTNWHFWWIRLCMTVTYMQCLHQTQNITLLFRSALQVRKAG
jgi:hypothetical protein